MHVSNRMPQDCINTREESPQTKHTSAPTVGIIHNYQSSSLQSQRRQEKLDYYSSTHFVENCPFRLVQISSTTEFRVKFCISSFNFTVLSYACHMLLWGIGSISQFITYPYISQGPSNGKWHLLL